MTKRTGLSVFLVAVFVAVSAIAVISLRDDGPKWGVAILQPAGEPQHPEFYYFDGEAEMVQFRADNGFQPLSELE